MTRAVTILALAAAAAIFAQAPAPPAFDVASVKIADNNNSFLKGIQRSGGRFTWTANRLVLVSYAFHVPYYRVSGLEAEPAYYEIQAETSPSATDDQIRLMLQKLLADRFQFAGHRETKDRPVLSLVVAKGGPKFKAVQPGQDVAPPPAFFRGRKAPEGVILNLMEGHPVLVARRVTMQQLADTLASELRAAVLEKTGLAGTFDFDLNYSSENTSNPPDDAPFLFTALPDQLGLKLDKQIAPVEILVVDHMEKKPTAN